jgi:hypothetical protein
MPNLKSFKSFNEERVNGVVITFGRFQPPTIGHEKLIEKLVSLSSGNKYRIYTSQTEDTKSNPLAYDEKIKFLRKVFPKHGRNIIEDTSIRNAFDAFTKLYEQGFTKVTLVVGEDRVDEFKRQLIKYNGVEARHGFYNFKDGIVIESAGERDPDADDISGMSSSKLREAAAANDLETFSKGLPKVFSEATELFNAVRSGLGLTETKAVRKHVQLSSVSETREDFVKGTLFKKGDAVRIIESNEVGVIAERGPNFVVVKTSSGNYRKWLTAIEEL